MKGTRSAWWRQAQRVRTVPEARGRRGREQGTGACAPLALPLSIVVALRAKSAPEV